MPASTHWPRIFFLWTCGILAAMQFAKISVAFQPLQQAYAVTPAVMGMVLSTVGLVGLLLGVTVGLFAQAIGYRRLLLAGLALWACSWLSVGIAPAAIGLMFMAGVAGGGSFALIPYLSQDSALQARANGAVAQTGNLGSTLGPPLFGAATAALALPGQALLVMAFALLGIGVATLGARFQTPAPNGTT